MSLKQVFESFEQVASTSGRNAKIAILDSLFATDAATFREVVEYCYNPFWTYRLTAPDVARIAPQFEELNDESSNYLWNGVKSLLSDLRSRKVELSEGRNLMSSLLAIGPALYRKYLAQIVNRDLKIGVQDFKKWFPGMIPAEPVMLCEKWDGEELTGSWIAETKWDGYRAAVMIDNDGRSDAISRGNKEFWNWEHIAEELQALGLRNVVLDGEFYAGSWGQTSSICKSQKPHKDKHLLKYYIFDIMTIEEWNAQKCSKTLLERKQWLSYTLLRDATAPGGQASPHVVVADYQRVQTVEQFEEVANTFYLMGFEGAVLKKLSSVYVWDRTNDWLKIKPEEECDVTIVDAYEGKGKHVGRLGGFIVKGTVTYKKKQYEILSRCGGGLKDTERDKYWEMHRKGTLNGLIVQVKYQDVTTEICADSAGNQPSLRFPRFQRERRDKMNIAEGGI